MQGAAMVEFAIVVVPLLLLAMGVAEFGQAIYQYEALTKATRDATRYLSSYLSTDPAYPIASAQCLAVYGSTTCPAGSATPLVNGLTTSMVVVCDSSHTTGCQDASDPPQFSNVPTYDTNNGASNGAPTGSVNLVEVKIKGFQYTPIETFFNLQGLIFGDIFTVMRQAS
ncbi:TadE/TadG family type IV pilus assembly protein [Trinickia dinghuensis]|uniref:Pilus assembly protein n=1 Tax=Trinickia dinghuensis TaxID=2291023 RepID=A0A3D8K113_9BURK|nr:TadE/TadG family type IV pilus assembly protein [Trinickia dinghuensis]RDU98606.1 pilus assembly protein [Trinickia dinghuensis]